MQVAAQSTTTLNDLSVFKDPGKTWRVAGKVEADLNTRNVLTASPGEGILANLPGKNGHGKDLVSKKDFGDVDVELEYLMALGSNSGIYLQGRYEIQLLDSWTSRVPKAGDNGGIYERWDDSRADGEKGYEGYAPRQNASRAPGLWQSLKISFQAPRFDAGGKKIQPAKILKVELNGVVIHENVELSGPTRGGYTPESASGPLRIQGDHGAVAFRNIKVTDYGQSRPAPTDPRPNRVYPILVDASASPVFRSFMDLPGGKRVVHAISVASNSQVHYTYDMDTGALIQVWRGEFLDATPMWFSRGDGSSRPIGAVLRFGEPSPAIGKLPSREASWGTDTVGTGFRPIGYTLNSEENPAFFYKINGWRITDGLRALPDGKGVAREIAATGDLNGAYIRLAVAKIIRLTSGGLYAIDDNSYFLKIDESSAQPFIRTIDGQQELLAPLKGQFKYSILF